LFQDLNRRGKTIVMVTHEPEFAAFTHRIITLRDGRLVSDMEVPDVKNAQEELARWKAENSILAGAAPTGEAPQ
ncbi:MAG: hypothetical protein FWE09_09010, partial [Treponema sp.]|nr:hypothetical protein [Treponema sp.]